MPTIAVRLELKLLTFKVRLPTLLADAAKLLSAALALFAAVATFLKAPEVLFAGPATLPTAEDALEALEEILLKVAPQLDAEVARLATPALAELAAPETILREVDSNAPLPAAEDRLLAIELILTDA